MSMDNAHAAGQGGTEVVPAPKTGAVAPASQSRSRARPDEAYRRFAVEELALQLVRGGALLARCEAIAKAGPVDQLGPIYAAARLMNANAQITKALAQVALVERRSKTIVETIQKPGPENAGLNSIFSPQQISSPQQRKKIRDVLERGLIEFLAEQKQDRERQEDLAVGCCI
jgi:hypothetical protein